MEKWSLYLEKGIGHFNYIDSTQTSEYFYEKSHAESISAWLFLVYEFPNKMS